MPEPSSVHSSVLFLVAALFLVILNGFFVLSEFAIVKVRRTRLEELVKSGKKEARLALKMSNSLDTYLSATQLGVTLSSLALGWIGEPAVGSLIAAPILKLFPENLALVHTVSFTIAFTLITLVHVVMGELVPKSIAIAKAEKASLLIAKPLQLFWLIFYPFIRLFDILASFFLRRIGIAPSTEQEQGHSEEELKIIVNESLNAGFIDSVEGEIIKNAVDFSDTVAKEVMTPRKDITCLYAEDSYEENIKTVLETKHTRYPYCDDGKDNPLGMIHLRDLLENVFASEPTHDLSKLIRRIMFVPENMSISDILAQMNKEQIHTALVVDEFGGTAGLLTMEDILEEVMGDISDEHDTKSEDFKKIDENSYEFDGMIDIESVCELLDFTLEDSEEILTLGGMVFNVLGRPPLVGDVVKNGPFEFKVLEVDGNRIQKILCSKIAPKHKEK